MGFDVKQRRAVEAIDALNSEMSVKPPVTLEALIGLRDHISVLIDALIETIRQAPND